MFTTPCHKDRSGSAHPSLMQCLRTWPERHYLLARESMARRPSAVAKLNRNPVDCRYDALLQGSRT